MENYLQKNRLMHRSTFGTFLHSKKLPLAYLQSEKKIIRFVTAEEIALHFSRPKNNFVIFK
jgi:hypothetical protein